jgi:hypothetical protein
MAANLGRSTVGDVMLQRLRDRALLDVPLAARAAAARRFGGRG